MRPYGHTERAIACVLLGSAQGCIETHPGFLEPNGGITDTATATTNSASESANDATSGERGATSGSGTTSSDGGHTGTTAATMETSTSASTHGAATDDDGAGNTMTADTGESGQLTSGSTGWDSGNTTGMSSTAANASSSSESGGSSGTTRAGASGTTTGGTTTGGTTTGGTTGGTGPPSPLRTIRPCGFDLDDDGVAGEPFDDCRVCDGITTDPDGDGTDENLVYVDCQAGTNDVACGDPLTPCQTISYAWLFRMSGPGDGAEDVICFKGTCSDVRGSAPPSDFSGEPGVWTRSATGNQAQAFEYATNPAMLVGWDDDGDGYYPPADSDDTAVLEGTGYLGYGILLNSSNDNSRVEFAHFEARGYGESLSGADQGFARVATTAGHSHVHFHDLSLQRINRGRDWLTTIGTFVARYSGDVSYLAFNNLWIADAGSNVFILSPNDSDDALGPVRIQDVDISLHGASGSRTNAVWVGPARDIEVLDSVFDAAPAAWSPSTSSAFFNSALIAYPCVERVWFRNNTVIDFTSAVRLLPGLVGTCDDVGAFAIDDVFVERNSYTLEYASYGAPSFLQVTPGSSDTRTVRDVHVSNNMVWTGTTAFRGLLEYDGGTSSGTQTGTLELVHNTVVGTFLAGTGLVTDSSGAASRHEDWVVANNVISTDTGVNLQLGYAPSNWQADGNIYDNDVSWVWNGVSQATLSDWRSASGDDADADVCSPAFEDAANGDLHLDAADVCALDQAVDAVGIVGVDFDNEPRQFLLRDCGADERQ